MKKYAVELLGTFFLVLTVAMSGNIFAIGAVLAAIIYIGAPVSGAHFNPAVSLAIWMQKKISSLELGRYVVAQMIGGLLAAAVSFFILSQKFIPAPGESVNWLTAVSAEIIFTFLLAFTVLNVALPKKAQGNQYFGLAIALTVVAGAFCVGSISGAAFNPAVGISPLLFDLSNISQYWSGIGLYLVGPLVGGALASLAYTQLKPSDEK